MKQNLQKNKYKVLVVVILAGIMLLSMIRVMRHPVLDLVGTSVAGYSLSFLNNPVSVSLLSGDRKPQIRF